ncbi:SGNH/GDSL hydrolase family protein [Frankia sp. CiP3]|uniref:SGNH/GDSL hydrolase family protein n=1 Tax=Frankia sp. CiP3 TaxID=2880971 RepID=UPI001EF4E5BF|nr:SGNH/GDSL hydrolase family protein [Frankia sp. CiP3]
MATVKDARRPYAWTAFVVLSLVGAATVFLAAWDLPPVSGVRVIAFLLYALGALGNSCVAALVVGLIVEWLGPWKQGRNLAGHIALSVFTVALLTSVILFDRWVVRYAAGNARLGWFLFWIVIAAVAAVVARVFALRPTSYDSRRETISVSLGAGVGGLTLGAFLIALIIGVLSLVRLDGLHARVPDPPSIGLSGTYVALGDSYAAGEGLRPFEAGTAQIGCNRSGNAFPRLLVSFDRQLDLGLSGFVACSGAVTADIYNSRGTGVAVPPQVHSGTTFPDVKLVSIMIGGNDVVFSTIVTRCFEQSDCVHKVLGWPSPEGGGALVSETLANWAPRMLGVVGTRIGKVYSDLRRSYPGARIVVVGYPYLFPGADVRPATTPNDCASVLRRFSADERMWIRTTTDRFNDLLYERTIKAGLEFVSPAEVWTGHEPCGKDGQYTNGIKLSLALDHPVDGGSFHPNQSGQRQLAVLLACYLNHYPSAAPNPFTDQVTPVDVQRNALDISKIDGLAKPGTVGLRDATGTPGNHLACPTSV